jgi:amyloid beta A4 precursor protein-binding family B member 2
LQGKDLFMDLEDTYLILIDPKDEKILNKQPITSIRVWGVGRDNGRLD